MVWCPVMSRWHPFLLVLSHVFCGDIPVFCGISHVFCGYFLGGQQITSNSMSHRINIWPNSIPNPCKSHAPRWSTPILATQTRCPCSLSAHEKYLLNIRNSTVYITISVYNIIVLYSIPHSIWSTVMSFVKFNKSPSQHHPQISIRSSIHSSTHPIFDAVPIFDGSFPWFGPWFPVSQKPFNCSCWYLNATISPHCISSIPHYPSVNCELTEMWRTRYLKIMFPVKPSVLHIFVYVYRLTSSSKLVN